MRIYENPLLRGSSSLESISQSSLQTLLQRICQKRASKQVRAFGGGEIVVVGGTKTEKRAVSVGIMGCES